MLELTKDSYQRVGLVGQEIKVRQKGIGRYRVRIDMVKIKEKERERVRWCFKNTFIDKVMVRMAIDEIGNLSYIN